MPVPDSLLPTLGQTPWDETMQDAWNTMRQTVNTTESVLTGKANTVHGHAIADVTGLQTALNAKAATSHTHPSTQITDVTATGRSLLTAASAQAARDVIGASSGNGVIVLPNFAAFPTPQNAVAGAVYAAIQD